jgi:D-alanine-D-alanine ligase and related ATP-grasp enzymes
MAKKLRVGVVFGGESGEHEVSLAGAASVLAAIDRERFEPVPIGITRQGRWLVGGDPLGLSPTPPHGMRSARAAPKRR